MRQQKSKENGIHLSAKVEGLVRVLSLLLPKYGKDLWDTQHGAALEMAERSRKIRAEEDPVLFARSGLDPEDVRDVATMNDNKEA